MNSTTHRQLEYAVASFPLVRVSAVGPANVLTPTSIIRGGRFFMGLRRTVRAGHAAAIRYVAMPDCSLGFDSRQPLLLGAELT